MFKQPAKIVYRTKPQRIGDLCNGKLSLAQHSLGLPNPQRVDILQHRGSVLGFETVAKGGFVHTKKKTTKHKTKKHVQNLQKAINILVAFSLVAWCKAPKVQHQGNQAIRTECLMA